MGAPFDDEKFPEHDVVPAIVKKKAVKWGVNLMWDFPASPEELFAAWVDGAQFAEITGKPAKGRAEVGAERAMFGGFAKGSIVELEPPRRVLELWRSKDFPKDAPDSVLQVFFERRKAGGTFIHIRQWAYEKAPGRPLDYETMMFWSQKILNAFQTHLRARHEPPPVPIAAPEGAAAKKLGAWLGPKRTGPAWRAHLSDLATANAKKRAWWRSKSPELKGLEAWVRGLAPFGDAALVRACVAAARTTLPVWTEAERTRPVLFDDVVSGFDREGGAPPAQILEAVEQWLRVPSTKNRRAATGTLDPTAQLRYSDKQMGDLSASRWLYALASARCAAHALEDDAKPAKEAPLAAACALEAIREDANAVSDEELTEVCEAIRRELTGWT